MKRSLLLACSVLAAPFAAADGTAWLQVSTDGHGDPLNDAVVGFAEFAGGSFTGTTNYSSGTGGTLWRSTDGGVSWAQVGANGLGDPGNGALVPALEFGGNLYLGTVNFSTGGELWRSPDGTTWTQVGSDGLGSGANIGVFPTAVFQDRLYACTNKFFGGGEIWSSSDGLSWTPAAPAGFGNASNASVTDGIVFGGELYLATLNTLTGSQIWRTSDGSNWMQVGPGGVGDANNLAIQLEVHLDHLLAGTYNQNGGQLWRSADGSTWTQVGGAGLGVPGRISLVPSRYGSELIVSSQDFQAGGELLRSLDGVSFEPVITPGFGDVGNFSVSALGASGGRLLAGTSNSTTGCELWLWDLPAVGTSYCPANANSSGAPAELRAMGTPSVSADCLRLDVLGCPAETPVVFFLGQGQTNLSFGDGRLCVQAPIQRVVPMVFTDALGAAGFELDLSSPYASDIVVGGTTYYQCWYRDLAGIAGYNTSDAIAVSHTP